MITDIRRGSETGTFYCSYFLHKWTKRQKVSNVLSSRHVNVNEASSDNQHIQNKRVLRLTEPAPISKQTSDLSHHERHAPPPVHCVLLVHSLADLFGDLVVEGEHPQTEDELVLALEVDARAEHRLERGDAVHTQKGEPVLVYPQHQLQTARHSRQVLVVLETETTGRVLFWSTRIASPLRSQLIRVRLAL